MTKPSKSEVEKAAEAELEDLRKMLIRIARQSYIIDLLMIIINLALFGLLIHEGGFFAFISVFQLWGIYISGRSFLHELDHIDMLKSANIYTEGSE